MDDQDYAGAVLAALRTGPYAGDVFDSTIPRGVVRPRRYLLVFVGMLDAPVGRLTGPHTDHDVRIVVRAVGSTVHEARAARAHGRERLLNRRLVTAGRNSAPITYEGSNVTPIGYDPDVGDGLWFHEDEYRWYSMPA